MFLLLQLSESLLQLQQLTQHKYFKSHNITSITINISCIANITVEMEYLIAVMTFSESMLILQILLVTFNFYAPPVGTGAVSVAFVRPSCPSVAYIVNNSRTQRASVPKFGRNATRTPLSRSKGQGHQAH